MNQLPKKLQRKLEDRVSNNALRSLDTSSNLVDFSSNDYLGFSASKIIFDNAVAILKEHKLEKNGATGSRLLSGNHHLYMLAESAIANFHKAPDALIFTSGYDANIGFFGSVPQKGDLIFYDELCHASIRDGIQLSSAKSYKYKHDDLSDLMAKANRMQPFIGEVYIVTESVFSMDGNTPELKALVDFSTQRGFLLVVDEAHGVGIFGETGAGKIQELGLEQDVFARIVTFGKAMGCHGAAILSSKTLKEYLINFARSFIYTTGLPPHSVATIWSAYAHLMNDIDSVKTVNRNIGILRLYIQKFQLKNYFITSNSAIHCCILPGNGVVKAVSEKLKEKGFDVKAILSPTVPLGQERLRLCVHSFNTEDEIKNLLELLVTFVE